VKTSWLKWKPDWDSAADKYMKAGMYWHFVHVCINYSNYKLQGQTQMGDSRKYPYPTTGSMNISTSLAFGNSKMLPPSPPYAL